MREIVTGRPVALRARYPDSWYFSEKPVPALSIPRQLFGLSTRPISLVPEDSAQPRPMVSDLGADAMFVWCYCQSPLDPDPSDPDVVPDYSRFSFPLQYRESEVFPSYDAREWRSADFLWRRVGFTVGGWTVTVWIWEGTRATEQDVADAETIVASVAPA